MKLDHPDLPYLVWLAEANLAGDHGPIWSGRWGARGLCTTRPSPVCAPGSP